MFVVGIEYVSVSVLYMQSELPRVTRRIRFRRVPIAINLYRVAQQQNLQNCLL